MDSTKFDLDYQNRKLANGKDRAHMEDKVRILHFREKGDERGHLVIAEGEQDIPFEIKRIFYIYGSDGETIRGKHANRNSEFVLINVAGSSKVKVIGEGGQETIYILEHPNIGLYLPQMVWKEMYDFSKDSVLLVLASEHYDPLEYIRDYDEYIKEVCAQ